MKKTVEQRADASWQTEAKLSHPEARALRQRAENVLRDVRTRLAVVGEKNWGPIGPDGTRALAKHRALEAEYHDLVRRLAVAEVALQEAAAAEKASA